MDRRKFLVGCSAGAAWLATSKWRFLASPFHSLAESDESHTFVLVFLRGGCDGLQLLAPHTDKYYQDARPHSLKVSARRGLGITQEFQGTGFRFHPEAAALKRLYDDGDLAVIHACGLLNGTRSHFDAMDLIERGIADNQADYQGWMARYLNAIQSESLVPGLSASTSSAEAFTGFSKAVSISNLLDYKLIEGIARPELVTAMYKDDPLMRNAAKQTLETVSYLQGNLTESKRRSLERSVSGYPTDWSSRELSRSLQTVAQMVKMDAGVRMVNVDYGGWDTHEHQNEVFPTLVRGLSRSLSAFYDDIRDYRNRVTVLVMSEFGRRLRANKSNGTDHGHGNLMLVLGGKVKGGEMYGKWPGLHPDALDKGLDLAVTTDYRNVLSNILKKSMKFNNIEQVFPSFNDYSDLHFIR